jgi:glutamine amidotransferase
MQLMCNSSEEGGTNGLGIFNVEVKRFSNEVKVPQIGWNRVENLQSRLFKNLESNYIYLVHSFYAPLTTNTIATATYDLEYSAALKKDNFYGTQFHPEKSGEYGAKILENFLSL